MKCFYPLILTTIIAIFFIGCAGATDTKLSDVSLGMSKSQVKEVMGNPDVVRGSVINKYNQVIEVWQYKLYSDWMRMEKNAEIYWLYFADGKIYQWGQAGDWEVESKNLYEIRVR